MNSPAGPEVLNQLRRAFDEAFAAPVVDQPEDFATLIVIRVAGQPFALRATEIAALAKRRRIVPAPSRVAELLGLAGIRGELVPVYDLAALLVLSRTGEPQWLALTHQEAKLALAFDTVESLVEIRETDLFTDDTCPAGSHVHQLVRIGAETRAVVNIAGGVDVILLDLGLPDSNGVETYTRTRARAPEVPVIILSAGDSESLALQMIQEGAEDYLVKSTCNRELLVRAVRYALVRHKQAARSATEASSGQAKIIGVIGAKGGVGTTTVACNLAAELRHQTGKRVLLADLDIHAGTASFLMSVDGQYSILDAMSVVYDLDHASWEQLVAKAADALHVLPSPGLLGSGELQAADVRRVLNRVKPMYDWMVLDLGRLNVISGAMLDIADEVFVVTTTGIAALHEAKRVIDALVRAGVEGDRLRLIVNQIEETHWLSGRQLNQIFGIHVYARLPNAGEELYKACVLGKLPPEDSHIRQEIAGLARNVAGLPEKKFRRTLQPLLSFAEKFCRSDAPAGRSLH